MGHHHSHHVGQSGAISEVQARAMRKVTTLAVGVAMTLVVLKTAAWSYTDTLSLLSSLADSLFDVLASAINFFALRYALKPADAEHRFGHNSIEDIAGLAQFAFICGSMVLVVVQSGQRLLDPVPVVHVEYGIAVMCISLLMTMGLVWYQRKVAKETGSVLIHADSVHYLSDILMNLAIILSLLAVKWFECFWLDSLLAIFVAIYVIKEAWEIGERSFNNLMDREMPDDEKARLIALLEAQPDIRGYYHLRTRYSGMKSFIQMHIELDKELSFVEADRISHALEDTIREHFPRADIILHQEPV